MITIFSTPKPFAGHIDVIQRNAILSWRRVDPDVEIILVGEDQGAAEVCEEYGIRHIKNVARNANGTKYLASIYDQVHEVARHNTLCHVNCDILLMSDFRKAVAAVSGNLDRFLMAGKRWDLDVRQPLNFLSSDWERNLSELARKTNKPRPAQWIDYFVFPKGLFSRNIPEFVVGRPGWDNWLLWYPLSQKVPVVDASHDVLAVHQNHDYNYHPDGERGVWYDQEAQENYRLHQGKFATLADATYVLRDGKMERNYAAGLVAMNRFAKARISKYWFMVLDATRDVRHRLGIRSRRAGQ